MCVLLFLQNVFMYNTNENDTLLTITVIIFMFNQTYRTIDLKTINKQITHQ